MRSISTQIWRAELILFPIVLRYLQARFWSSHQWDVNYRWRLSPTFPCELRLCYYAIRYRIQPYRRRQLAVFCLLRLNLRTLSVRITPDHINQSSWFHLSTGEKAGSLACDDDHPSWAATVLQSGTKTFILQTTLTKSVQSLFLLPIPALSTPVTAILATPQARLWPQTACPVCWIPTPVHATIFSSNRYGLASELPNPWLAISDVVACRR